MVVRNNEEEWVIATPIQEIPVQTLENWFRQETERALFPLQKEGEKLVSNLTSKIDDVKTVCKTTMHESEEEVKVGKKPRKARAMFKLARYFLQLMEGVSLPNTVSYESLAKLDNELERILNTIARQRAIWYSLISPMFIISRRKLDLALEKTANAARELHVFMEDKYSKAKTVEETYAKIDKVRKLRDELERAKEEKERTELEIKQLKTRVEEQKKSIELIQTKPELASLAVIEERIRELDKNIKHSLRHLQKPFKKLLQLTQDMKEDSTSINIQKLNEYLDKPFVALATEDEGYPVLRRILEELSSTMEQGKLKLKAARVRKAQEDIAKIVNDNTLAQLQRECKEALKQLQSMQASETIATLKKEYSMLQESLNELQRRQEIENSKLTSQRSEHEEKFKEAMTHKAEIERNLQKTLNKNIKIIL